MIEGETREKAEKQHRKKGENKTDTHSIKHSACEFVYALSRASREAVACVAERGAY